MLFPDDQFLRSDGAADQEYTRKLCASYKDESERFRFERHNDYSKQFAHIYASRLEQMRGLLTDRVRAQWGSEVPLKKMFELREEEPEKCIIIGTLFKHQVSCCWRSFIWELRSYLNKYIHIFSVPQAQHPARTVGGDATGAPTGSLQFRRRPGPADPGGRATAHPAVWQIGRPADGHRSGVRRNG